MKKQKNNDVEKRLRQLPSLKDHQSKEKLYLSVRARVNIPERKFPPWLFPSLATLTVILLLTVFIPTFINQMNPVTMEDSSEGSHSKSDSSLEESKGAEKLPEQDKTDKNHPLEKNSNQTQEHSSTDTHSNDSNTSEDSVEVNSLLAGNGEGKTYAYPGMNGETVVPLTQTSSLSDRVPAGSLGLSERITEDLTIDIEQGRAKVIFPDQFKVSGSSYSQMVIDSIRWELEGENIKTIQLETSSGRAVPLGNYGEVKELSPIEKGEYIFKLYQFEGSSHKFLAPVQVPDETSFREALQMMKTRGNEKFITSPVPGHVQLATVETSSEEVSIQVEHQAWASEQQVLTMMEAIMATAHQFGYKEVKFEGIQVQSFSFYDLDQPIQVPEKVNPI
ncbi:hypothetical protein [Halobacillus litoralis]|uniref:hypothetical protein n=1 Tax=Halobacillus litoralis TaxID=45668 RepID=UPI001CFD051E|nr:hypothetical protein [Halobacillus litoralis]